MSKSNIGIYENLPRGRQSSQSTTTTAPSAVATGYGISHFSPSNHESIDSQVNFNHQFSPKQDKDKNFNTTEEKPMIGSGSGSISSDNSWFSQSFVNAGGLAMRTTNGVVSSASPKGNSASETPFLNLDSPHSTVSARNNNAKVNGDKVFGVNGQSSFLEPVSSPSTNNNNNNGGHSAMKYRGCKTSPIKSTTEDWDFLASLNDILRKENFLSDSEQSEYNNRAELNSSNASNINKSQNQFGSQNSRQVQVDQPTPQRYYDSSAHHLQSNNININSNGINNNNNNNDSNENGPQPSNLVPMSPRPPRPSRRSDGRRKDFMKARSMNLDILPPPVLFGNDCDSSSMRMGQSTQRQGQYFHQQPSPTQNFNPSQSYQREQRGVSPSRHFYPNQHQLQQHHVHNNSMNYHADKIDGRRTRSPSPPPPPPHMPLPPQQPPPPIMNLPPKHLPTTISSSLDSIYDRLRSVDEYEHQNGSGGMQHNKYLPQAPLSSRQRYSDITSGSHQPSPFTSEFSRQPYTNALYSNSNSSAPNWSHYRPQDDFQIEQYSQHKIPQDYSMMPQFKSKSYGSLKGSLLGLDYEDRLLRLESDKDTLHLQVSVLSDQIEAQTNKIQDLEKMLDDKKNTLETTEEQLQRELLTRSSLETQKLELMTEISSLRFKHASLERENVELKGRCGSGQGRSLTDLNYPNDNNSQIWNKPPVAPIGVPRGTSPITDVGQRLRLTSTGSENMPNLIHQQQQRVQTPPANAYRRVDQTSTFGTLPRRNQPSMLSTFNSVGGVNHPVDSSTKCNSLSSGNIHAISVNFTQPPGNENWQRTSNNNAKTTSNGSHKPRRILRILGKLKRSNSGGLDNEVVPENHGDAAPTSNPFARGGLRATAAPRLGWMKEQTPVKMPDGPVTSWDSQGVENWLIFLGLGMYGNEIKRWVKSGQQLLDASPQELDKELNIKNGLHRKKLNLALHYLKNPEAEDNAGKLDYHWVTRWLDDVGLPQYKESFADARVDGRVLSHLTAEDLIALKVTSLMHHASIKRGIQILRIHKFHPSCLCRRGSSAGGGVESLNKDTKAVACWTNHRVMEWLKHVDLAEYAPNLRGSGVHGALIVFEPRFNAELLAVLLSIPANKTLLRRHLSLQFNELVGRIIVQEKRLVEIAPDFIPINPTVKVKPAKKTPTFPLRKKRLSTEFSEELLCPLDLNTYPSNWDSQNQLNLDTYETEGSFGGKVSNL